MYYTRNMREESVLKCNLESQLPVAVVDSLTIEEPIGLYRVISTNVTQQRDLVASSGSHIFLANFKPHRL